MNKKYYITTPIYYPSGNPHIGHCYTTLFCDVISRYKRKKGFEVTFLTGTDEHGQKIEENARKNAIDPLSYVDAIVENFKQLWSTLDISYDRFVRTTDGYHKQTVQEIFKKLYEDGYIYKGKYSGKYCTPCETFMTDNQLVEGKCPECGREVEMTEETAYFFRLSDFSGRIGDLLTNTDFLQPQTRVNEMMNNFIKPGLEDLCVSRTSFKWGIPVTFDDDHVVYVWIDALSNYISALGYENDTYSDFEKFWPADLHVMAKEIVRFHAIIWPAILMALDLELPEKIYGHGWITFGGDKMSKSKGNVVDPILLSNRYGKDVIRYCLLREMGYGVDSSYTNENMLRRQNQDLSNGLGNLLSRTISMVHKYFGGQLPVDQKGNQDDIDLINKVKALPGEVENKLDELLLADAIDEIFEVIGYANKYIDITTPWIIAKDESQKARLSTILYNLLETIRIASSLLDIFIPESIKKVCVQLNIDLNLIEWETSKEFGLLPKDIQVVRGDIIFPRFDIEAELKYLEELSSKSS